MRAGGRREERRRHAQLREETTRWSTPLEEGTLTTRPSYVVEAAVSLPFHLQKGARLESALTVCPYAVVPSPLLQTEPTPSPSNLLSSSLTTPFLLTHFSPSLTHPSSFTSAFLPSPHSPLPSSSLLLLPRPSPRSESTKRRTTRTEAVYPHHSRLQASALQACFAACLHRIEGEVRLTKGGTTSTEGEVEGEASLSSFSSLVSADALPLKYLISLMLHSSTLWCSPLARSTQTAMLVLQPLAVARQVGDGEARGEEGGGRGGPLAIELKRHARERRELTSLTTSIGNR